MTRRPTLKAICKIGTIAHNRTFTARELREYSGVPIGWLRRKGYVGWTRIDAAGRVHRWAPTPAGWRLIERACKRSGQ